MNTAVKITREQKIEIKTVPAICIECRNFKGFCKKGMVPKPGFYGKLSCKRHHSKK